MGTNHEIGYLVGTGAALGVVHVLTGPDHLSALATLSANVSNKAEACTLGIRWGIGHSSGLLVVGGILILLSDAGQETVDMPEYATHVFETIVGVFMLLLGSYGLRRAWMKRPTHYSAIGHSSPTKKEHTKDGIMKEDNNNEFTFQFAEDEVPDDNNQDPLEICFDGDERPSSAARLGSYVDENIVAIPSNESDLEEAVVVELAYGRTVSPSRCRRCIDEITTRVSAKTMAFFIGIVHGLAGPGGVLGVIPAVQLQNWKLASIYLGCFCVSSTLTMGCFATIYGACSSSLIGNSTETKREFKIECFSAGLSILVGITWLVLLSFGKLEDVFP